MPFLYGMASVIIGILLMFLLPTEKGTMSFENAEWSAPQTEVEQGEKT